MRNIIKKAFICLFTTTLLSACDSYDGDGGSLAETEITARLSRGWKASKVTYNNIDVTSLDFSDFRITFVADGTWTTVDGDPAFAPNGDWVFAENQTTILLMNGVEVGATFTFDGQQLNLSFILNNNIIGRTKGIDGNYLFNLTPVEEN